jgi:hypothetical protein
MVNPPALSRKEKHHPVAQPLRIADCQRIYEFTDAANKHRSILSIG